MSYWLDRWLQHDGLDGIGIDPVASRRRILDAFGA